MCALKSLKKRLEKVQLLTQDSNHTFHKGLGPLIIYQFL